MIKNSKSKKEINLLLFAFIVIGLLGISTKYFEYKTIEKITNTTTKLFDYPLKISSIANKINHNISKIHDYMKDIVLTTSYNEIMELNKEIDKHEKEVYKNIQLIEKSALNEEEIILVKKVKQLFLTWEPMRSEIIELMNSNHIQKAREVTRNKCSKHVAQLNLSTLDLYNHTQKKTIDFKTESESFFKTLKTIDGLTSILFLLIFVAVSYYIIIRISSFIYKNDHLKDVLSLMISINKLISKEENKKILLQKCCDILSSKLGYEHSRIITIDSFKKVACFASGSESKKYGLFKKKLDEGWIPECMEEIYQSDKKNSTLYNIKEDCLSCPLFGLSTNTSAYTIKLQSHEKTFGYLTLYIEKKYLKNDDEIVLLNEISDDISNALYSIEMKMQLNKQEILYANIINSLDNVLFAKDINGIYITSNKAFENLVGKSKSEIIGKNDYDIFDKNLADFFREHDKRMLQENRTKSNFEWVKYPDGVEHYLLTIKSPLIDSEGNVFGIVGNATDFTVQRENELALIESQRRYAIAEKIGKVGSWEYDIKTQTLWASAEAKRIYGLHVEPSILSIDMVQAAIVNSDKDRIHQSLLNLIEKSIPYNVQFQINPYDGSPITTIASIAEMEYDKDKQPIKVLGFIQDTTEKQQTLHLLENKKKELEKILEEAPNPIMLHNEDGKVLMVNKIWREITGYRYEEIDTIEKWTEKAYGKLMAIRQESINLLYKIDKKIDEGEFEILTKNGDIKIWQFSSSLIGLINDKKTIISSAMDVTQLKEKDELMITQSRSAAMGEMISMIAHQWRQPISVIAMSANNILLDIELNSLDLDELKIESTSILEYTQHLSKTIEDFRDFFKPNKEKNEEDICEVLNISLKLMLKSFERYSISCNINSRTDEKVLIFKRELIQVFINILNNAKEVLVVNRETSREIIIDIIEKNGYIITKIYNNGGKIEEENVDIIFEPYFSTKDEQDGTGLGLYMSKLIIEKHMNGKLFVENIDEGVCFNIHIPK